MLSSNADNKGSVHIIYMEAFARALSGITPWLKLEGGDKEDICLHNQHRDWVVKDLTNTVDSDTAKH